MIHQPSDGAITLAIAKARARLPHLGSRLDNAAFVLADVNTYIDTYGAHWSIRSAEERWRPRDLDSFCALAEWLADAPAYTHPDTYPAMPDVLPAARETLKDVGPLMTHNQYRRWLATGEPPSLQSLSDTLDLHR